MLALVFTLTLAFAAETEPPSNGFPPQLCGATSAVAGLLVGDVAVVAAGVGVAGGLFLLGPSQTNFYNGIVIIGLALASTVVVGPLSASVATTMWSESCTGLHEVAWQPAALAMVATLAGASAGIAWDTLWGGGFSVDGDLALSAGIGAFTFATIGAGLGGAWFAAPRSHVVSAVVE